MRANGEWLLCEDGERRPSLVGAVQAADGQPVEVTFLLDGGADRTVFSARFLHRLLPLIINDPEQSHLAGVGGAVNSITVETTLEFTRDDGRSVVVRGQFGVFTAYESADLSILGRDVTNNFSVIYDYPHQIVALLALPHFYEIKRAS
jgi:hypothetical protein